jgi:hypothetical protein
MADPLKFVVVFTFIDQMSDKLRSIGGAMDEFTDRVSDAGDRLHGMGERVGVETAILSEGATKLHEWSEALNEPALGVQQNMATMTRLADTELDKIKEHAIAFANTRPDTTAEQWAAGFTRMRGVFQDTAAAMGAEDVSAMLKRLGVDSGAATRLIQVAWSNMRTDAATTRDQLTHAIPAFGLLDPSAVQQVAMGMGRLGASAAAAHAPFSEVLALSGEAQKLLGGGPSATIFASMIQGLETATAKGKATIDFSHGLIAALQQLKSQIIGTPIERLAALQKIGGSNAPQMFNLLDHLDEVAAKQISDSAGALSKAYGTATANTADQVTLLHQNISNLYGAIHTPALPTINRWLGDLTGTTRSAAGAVEHHSSVAQYAALSVTAFAGKGIKALSKLTDWESIALHGMYAWDTVKALTSSVVSGIGSTVLGAILSIVKFGALLYTNPLTWYVADTVAVGLAAYKIYEHWGTIATFFKGMWSRVEGVFSGFNSWVSAWAPAIGKYLLIGPTRPFEIIGYKIFQHWDRIKNIFGDEVDWMRNAGANMVKALSEDILSAVEWPIKAARSLAAKIGGYFHFHSPPSYGLLHEAIVNFRRGEKLTKHLQPAPIITSVERVAEIAAASINLSPSPFPFWRTPSPILGEGNESFFPLKGEGPGWGFMTAERTAQLVATLTMPFRFAGPAKFIRTAPSINLMLPKSITAAPIVIAAPERKTAAAMAGTAPSRGTQPVTINVGYTVNAASPQDWVRAARQHADELMRIIDDKLTRRQRLQFA